MTASDRDRWESRRRTDAIERALARLVPDWLSPSLVSAIVVIALILTLALVAAGVIRLEQQVEESRSLGRCILAQSAEVHDDPSFTAPGIESLRQACSDWVKDGPLTPPPPP